MEKRKSRFKYTIVGLFLVLTLILAACEPLPPTYDERCTNYEDYVFYQIEKTTAVGTVKDQWVLQTPDGDIDIPDRIYENAMAYEYSDICYEREDKTAIRYLYTKKSNDIVPEPEVITETIIETVTETVEVPVNTHSIVEAVQFLDVQVVPVDDKVVWVTRRVLEELEEAPEFQEGDVIVTTLVYDPHTISADLYWIAQIRQYRYGIEIKTYTYEETYEVTDYNSVTELGSGYADETSLEEIYGVLYPEEEADD
jgi:hypothetical protein